MPTPPDTPLIDPATVHRTVLPNGLTVLVRRDASAPVVAVNTFVRAGYFDETDDVVGVAHVLEHMFFKGTPRRGVGEIAKQTKAQGGYLNAHTIYDHTSYYAVLPSSGFVEGLDIQADAYANSLVDADELAKELEVIIQEAKRKLDNPGAVTVESLYALLHDRHRVRRWRIGTEEGLRRLTRDDVAGFYRTYYRPSATVLSIVGDVDPDVALAHVRERYGALPDGAVPTDRGPQEDAHADFRYRELSGDVQQAQVAFGWRTPGTRHDDTPHLDLAAAVLGTGRGSRLYRAVRERSLASHVGAYDSTPTELGIFVVHAEGDPARLPDAARAMWTEVRALREQGVGAHELARVQRIAESRWLRRLETMEGQASWLAEWEALGDWRLGEDYRARVQRATPDDVTEAARRWLDPERAGVIVYRPQGSAPIAADATAFAALLAADAPAPVGAGTAPAPQAPAVHTGAPALERVEAGVHVFRTAQGIPVLVARKPGARIVNLGVYARGGASEEADADAGLTMLMAHTSVKGTERRTAAQIAAEAEVLGGSVGASVGSETFGWGIAVPLPHAADAASLLADVVQRPVFPDAAVDTERDVALQELRLLRDDMYRWPMRLASEAAYAGHPYGRPVGGTDESLRALDAAQLRAWHRARALSGDAVLAVVGDLAPEEAAALVAREFGALAPREVTPLPAPTWREGARRDDARAKKQTALALLFPGPTRTDPARVAAQLLAGIASGLGGRFFDELRDRRSLAYTVHAFASPRRLAGTFGAYIATGPTQEDEARAGLLAEFERLRDAPVSAEELERAQTYALGTHAIARQSGGAVMGELVDAWLTGEGLSELETYDARVRAVTPETIQTLARDWFDPARRVEGVVRGTG
ncbi:M16 family metallopeptidase [Roseisolibacter agri]|uniref:Peptidase M16 n=1 Tax=Roseisolibacter agri TaxID=2014610 RepID=A0AA37Q7D3_9BACT|nr:pitrilysin family protein [Roseisolibacter agri]GLC24361.1 peptidase M16 [Roseisolibacter agri]